MEKAEGKKEVKMPEADLTPEALETWKDRVGAEMRVSNTFNQTVSYEAIRNFVNGIGDNNPLYRDRDYAQKTSYGDLVAPPNWFYSVFPTWVAEGLPGLHGWHSGTSWEFYKPVYMNDFITPRCTNVGFDVKGSQFVGKGIFRYQRSEFINQRNEVVARCYAWAFKGERQAARSRGKYTSIKLPHPWTDGELAKVEEEALNEKIRGSEVRYWEDTEVGEDLPPVVKGPFGLTDMVAYCVGASPIMIAAHSVMLRNYRRHPAWAFRDPKTYALEPIYAVHYNEEAARAAGLPYPYDVGAQRHCWVLNLITNWVGDEGWIKKNYAEYRKFVYFSEVVWMKGSVIKKYVDGNGEYCVDIETHGVNQRGEDTVPGFTTVILPSREAGTWPARKRLPAKEFRGTGK